MNPNNFTHPVIGAAIDVHREIGPDQNEGHYEDALEIALQSSGLQNDSSVSSNSLCWKNSSAPIQRRGLKDTENNMNQS
jgi:hypothetical protein